MRLDYGAATHVGLRRRENQDRHVARSDLFAVADGVGSHRGGGTAAGIAAEILAEAERVESLDQLIALVGTVNEAILEAAKDDPRLFETSTTLCVLAHVGRSRLAACNVGDSRLYALYRGGLSQVSVDHTISENLRRDGIISAAEAVEHVDRHTLTRAVGLEPRVYVDGWELAAVGGTRFLLCSDGLSNEVPEPEIAEILRFADDPSDAASRLVQRAVRPGRGRDNATAVVVEVAGDPELDPSRPGQLVLGFHPAVAA